MRGNQEIKCNVKNCRHNDKNNYCRLSHITVGESRFDAQRAKDTECGNFESET